jgi:hypothetical protein
MATYYARSTGGNWSANTSWDSTSSSGAGPAGPPIAGDTAIFDSGSTGTITLTAAAACLVLNMAGHGGTLALDKYTLTIGANGTVALGGTITSTSTGGRLGISGNVTIDSNGVSLPNITFTAAGTYTLEDDLTVIDYLQFYTGVPTFAGAFDISCATLYYGGTGTITLCSGQSLTVSTEMTIISPSCTMKANTASASAYLIYNGSAANCKVGGVTFTDIDYSGSTVTVLDNWYGGTLTRTSGIYNVTSASIPAVTDVKSGVEYGGVDDASANKLTGTYAGGGGGAPHFGDRSGGKQ